MNASDIFGLFGGLTAFLFVISFTIGIILIMRLLGAWMLRIDVVIRELRKINENFHKQNSINRSRE